MESNKGSVWSVASVMAVIATFAVCVVIGYFSVSIVKHFKNGKYDPIVISVMKQAFLESDGKYGLELECNWVGDNPVIFELFQPQDTLSAVLFSNTGHFSGVPAIDGGMYKVRASVTGVPVRSELYSIYGFNIVEPVVDEPVNPLDNVKLSFSDVQGTDNLYSFNVMTDVCDDISDRIEYILYRCADSGDTVRTDYSNRDGHFSKIKVDQGYIYLVRLEIEMDENRFVSDMFPVEKVVWRAPKPKMSRLSKGEVQDLINERKSLLNNSQFVKSAKVKISNQNETSSNWKTLDNFMQQKFAWSSVVVDSLSFNKDNQVEVVHMSVNY